MKTQLVSVEYFEHLWEELREIPITNDDELEKSFLHFEVGASKLEVWAWIEEKFEVCLGTLINNE